MSDPLNLPAPKPPRKVATLTSLDELLDVRISERMAALAVPGWFPCEPLGITPRKAKGLRARGVRVTKIGKSLYVNVAEFNALAEANAHGRSAPAPVAPPADDLDTALGLAPARAAGGRR